MDARRAASRACFPDPDPDPNSSAVKVDDITRMNATAVSRVVYVRSDSDIKESLRKARAAGKRVAVRGTKHSMGGQSIAEDSFVIDMTKMKRMRFNRDSDTVVCECGCTWADLILYLNQFGMSPRTMQSYASFSIGGTLAVNGHGITTDFTLAECVESFRLIKADGEEVTCSRGAAGASGELFKLALGGYGLFGIVWEVTMQVMRNSRMDMEALHLNCDEFTRHYWADQASDDVVMKLARLNIIDTNKIDYYVFRRSHDESLPLVSNLSSKPREMSWQSKIMYKWLMPAMKEVRYALEQRTGQALDWGAETERNHMLHESAAPLAQLYEPLFQLDDTFVLQEFFCPREKFKDWIARTKRIYQELASTTEIVLLNTTIRFVKKDLDTFLPYAKVDMFAFVLYFRLPRSPSADGCLKRFHNLFVEQTLALGGSFYLPYRCHYSHAQLEDAYPEIQCFFSKKEIYDPDGLFDSLWFRLYGAKYLSESYLAVLSQPLASQPWQQTESSGGIPRVPDRREDAFRSLMASPSLRRDFKDGFLTQIFNVMDNEQLFRMVVKATRDPENKSDIEIYRALQRLLSDSGGLLAAGMKTFKQLKQVSSQKKELAREVSAMVARLGKFGQLHDYLSIGDAGRMVLPLRTALEMKGRCWVAHATYSDDIPAVVERGSLDPVGVQVTWQLLEAGAFDVPNEAADLVTMMQGLHHIPQKHLQQFLKEVFRVLRPGGLFIFREHDASPELMPMLDLAHNVYNAVMGVTDNEEEREIRAFRPVSQWRHILKTVGFEDSMLYEMEPYDPTVDEMMCFVKPPWDAPRNLPVCEGDVPDSPGDLFLPEKLMAFVQGGPQILLQSFRDGIDGLLHTLPAVVAIFKEKVQVFSSGQQLVAKSLVDQMLDPLLTILGKLRPILQQAEVGKTDSSLFEFLPSEVLLLVPALMRKVQRGSASANEMFAAAILQDMLDAMQGKTEDVESKGREENKGVMDAAVRKEDVEELLQLVLWTFPQLSDPGAIETMGFPKRAARVLCARLGRDGFSDSSDMSETLSSFLDEQAWVEMRAYLLEAVSAQQPPTKDSLFNVKKPWGLAMRSFLGSKHVRLNGSTLAMCNLLGLAELPPMWRAAQALRKSAHSESESGIVTPMLVRNQSDADRKQSIQRALASLTSQLQEVQMDEGQQYDLCGVSEVVFASFGYTSITARPREVTQMVQKMLRNGRLQLRGVDLCQAFRAGGKVDALRKFATSSTRCLVIRYRSSQLLPPEDFLPRVETLLTRLRGFGWTDGVHTDAAQYTWYKLNEWMQVEILQIFGQSLENEPWYRFPYFEFLKLYFDTLFQESAIVQGKLGFKKAFGSTAFITSLVPGLVMAVLFAQLKVLSTPLLVMPGFGENYDEDYAKEQLVILRPDAIDWKRLDERITDITCPAQGLYVMKVPTFKVLTEICKTMAKDENITILEISSQRQVQMKVTTSEPGGSELKNFLNSLPGCELALHFSYPTDGRPGPSCTHWALAVDVPYLLATIRACNQRGLQTEQIYDFYN